MGEDVHERGIEREYGRRRRSSWRRLIPLTVIVANCVLQLTTDSDVAGVPSRTAIVTILLSSLTAMLLFRWRGRTIVGTDGITARGTLRSVTRTWHTVYDIRPELNHAGKLDGSEWLTYLYDVQGRRFLLPYVDDWQLPDFHAEIADLRATAALHHGTTWEPRPATEALIRRRARHRKAWEFACLTGFIAVFAAFVFLA
ncbi:hypothetical protein OG194_24985 [Streptomyces sp. NBC_01288]|uniref:hypothetical protein n=1 Tax=Streptomyces sp. NBC_01288 TaxID=2903814 RepID=UPI002E15CE91|nr:hypothetical protein OG194_24985 [Streptomyces sp. NBC_01288]